MKKIWQIVGWATTNLANLKTTILGIGGLLILGGTAVQAWADGDPTTVPDWGNVWVAATAVGASVALIFASKD